MFIDPRTRDWLLMASPIPLLMILATYLYFCLWIGPNFMKERQPMELKTITRIYHITQVVLNVFIVYEVSDLTFMFTKYYNCLRSNMICFSIWKEVGEKITVLLVNL